MCTAIQNQLGFFGMLTIEFLKMIFIEIAFVVAPFYSFIF